MLRALVVDAPSRNPSRAPLRAEDLVDPEMHAVFTGNDDLDGGNGSDLVVGDDLEVLLPLVVGGQDEHVVYYGSISDAVWRETEQVLTAQQTARGRRRWTRT